jgi:membrane protein
MSHLVRWGRAFAELLHAAWVEYERDHARYLAVAMVYYALVSMIPLLLLLLAALGLLLRFTAIAADARQQVLAGIEGRFGPELSATVVGLLQTLQRESIVATVISLAGLLLAASVLFRHLRWSFRAIWKYDPPLVSGSMRAVVWTSMRDKAISFAVVLAGGGLLLAALVLIAVTQWLAGLSVFGPRAGWVLSAATSATLMGITFACMFRFLPPVPLRWRDVWPATLLCVVSWMVASELLALYGVVFGDGPSASGALGAVLAIMLYMNIVSQVLFFGAELCKVFAMRGLT